MLGYFLIPSLCPSFIQATGYHPSISDTQAHAPGHVLKAEQGWTPSDHSRAPPLSLNHWWEELGIWYGTIRPGWSHLLLKYLLELHL